MIATDLLLVHLSVHPIHHHYYFGDYYHDDFARIGFHPWYDLRAYHHGYDPMWSYCALLSVLATALFAGRVRIVEDAQSAERQGERRSLG